MNGWFQGISKKALLNAMRPRDLVLSEHSDDNEVPTILGRCRVARRRPLEKLVDGVAVEEKIPKGAYVCRYDVRIPKKREQGFGYVIVEPYKGEPFDDEVLEQNIKPVSLQQKQTVKEQAEPAAGVPLQQKRKSSGNETDSSRQQKRSRAEESEKPEDPQTKRVTADETPQADEITEHPSKQSSLETNEQVHPEIESVLPFEAKSEVTPANNEADKTDLKDETESANTSGNVSGTPSVTSSGADQSTSSSSSTHSSSSDDDDDGEDTEDAVMKIGDTENFLPASPRKQVGIIHVGEGHQAVVPPLSSLKDPSAYNTQSKAICVWIPGRIPDDALKRYFSDSRKELKKFVERQKGEYIFEADTVSMPPSCVAESDPSAPRGALWLKKDLARECNGDELLDELHRNDYSVEAALAVITKTPRKFLTLWSASERQRFELGFQKYCGTLRSIAKLIPSKNAKDVVDYHFRFKIPEQFRKYAEQKMQQARRMMATADLRLLENASAGGKSGTSIKKSRNW